MRNDGSMCNVDILVSMRRLSRQKSSDCCPTFEKKNKKKNKNKNKKTKRKQTKTNKQNENKQTNKKVAQLQYSLHDVNYC